MKPIFNAFRGINTKDLSSTQRMLIIGLYSFMDGDGYCFPSYKAIAEITGLSKNAISTNIKKLVDNDWISYKRGGVDSSNKYHLNLEKIGVVTGNEKKGSVTSIKKNKEDLRVINGRYMNESEAKAGGYIWK